MGLRVYLSNLKLPRDRWRFSIATYIDLLSRPTPEVDTTNDSTERSSDGQGVANSYIINSR